MKGGVWRRSGLHFNWPAALRNARCDQGTSLSLNSKLLIRKHTRRDDKRYLVTWTYLKDRLDVFGDAMNRLFLPT